LADISTKMSVSGLSQYKSAMSQAAQSVKTLDAQLKQNEAQYKASGDREAYMAEKSKLLADKLKAQKEAAKQAGAALDNMRSRNVDPLSKAYQQMEQKMAEAQTGVLETTAAINNLSQSEQSAAKGADQLTASVQGISKKISLDQVINGVNKITSGLETAAKKAVELGKAFAELVMESAERGDNIATMASILQMDVVDYQKYSKVFDTLADITVQDWRRAQDKVRKAMTSPTEDQNNVLRMLGISTSTLQDTGNGVLEPVKKDVEDVLWAVGEALRRDVKSGKLSLLEADEMANVIFGKNWANLNPLFDQFTQETFKAAVDSMNAADEESIKNLAALNDEIALLKGDFDTLQDQILAGMAPALTKAAEAIDKVLGKIMAYLQTDQGKEMLDKLGESVAGLFDDLTKINPDEVVSNFVTVFDQLTNGLEFLANNWTKIVNGIKEIGIAFGLLKIGEGVLEGLRLINGFKNLTGAGGGDPTQTTGTKTGGLNSKIMSGIGAMVVVNWDPSRVREIEKETGRKRDALAKYLDELNGSNLYELQQEWDNNKTKNSGGNFLQQVMDSPKNLAKIIWDALTNKGTAGDWSSADGDDWSVKVKPEAEEGSAEALAEQIGAVTVPVNLQITGFGGSAIGGGGGGGLDPLRQTLFGRMTGFANGLPFVPWDGYIAMLHRGERVLTASQNRNYTYNNHNYFGNVNLNNGMEVDALADSIAKQTRKQSRGYGD